MANISRSRATLMTGFAGLIVLVTSLPTWARGSTPTATGTQVVKVSGTAASPATASVGLVIIAAALVLGLAGRWMRQVALVVVIVAVGFAIISVVGFILDPNPVVKTAAADVTSVRAITTTPDLYPWPYVALGVLIIVAVLNVWLLTQLGQWGQVGEKYRLATHKPTQQATTDHEDPQVVAKKQAIEDWDAITRGEDPT